MNLLGQCDSVLNEHSRLLELSLDNARLGAVTQNVDQGT